MALNEQEILRGVNQKDLKAWETLYASYYAALCSYADGIVKDSDTAQDIVQDTLIRIWNSDRTFPDIKELTWYLYRSTYNNALFYLRTQASRQNILRKMVAEEVELPDEQFALTVREELIRQLYVYIEDLPEERKKILLMSIQGHSGNEIADLLGISINTVKTQKNRGFKYLREFIKSVGAIFKNNKHIVGSEHPSRHMIMFHHSEGMPGFGFLQKSFHVSRYDQVGCRTSRLTEPSSSAGLRHSWGEEKTSISESPRVGRHPR